MYVIIEYNIVDKIVRKRMIVRKIIIKKQRTNQEKISITKQIIQCYLLEDATEE